MTFKVKQRFQKKQLWNFSMSPKTRKISVWQKSINYIVEIIYLRNYKPPMLSHCVIYVAFANIYIYIYIMFTGMPPCYYFLHTEKGEYKGKINSILKL